MVRTFAAVLGVVAASVTALVLVLVLWATGRIGGPDEAAYVARNEEVLRALPVLPGASNVRVGSRAKYDGTRWPEEIGRPTGWITTRQYSLPDGRSWAEVRSFYLARLLPAWSLRALGDNVVTFVRGSTEIHVAAAPLIPAEPSEAGFAVSVERDCGPLCAAVPTRSGDEAVVELRPEQGSALSGVAVIDPSEGSMIVEIDVAPLVDAGVSHVHRGSCAETRSAARATYRLGETSNGQTTIGLAVPLEAVTARPHYIDVHLSSAAGRVAACGDIR